jgi:hypothetical protein
MTLWQFWTDFAVKVIAAIGTISAVVVALFGAKLRSVRLPPALALTLKQSEGLKAGYA